MRIRRRRAAIIESIQREQDRAAKGIVRCVTVSPDGLARFAFQGRVVAVSIRNDLATMFDQGAVK